MMLSMCTAMMCKAIVCRMLGYEVFSSSHKQHAKSSLTISFCAWLYVLHFQREPALRYFLLSLSYFYNFHLNFPFYFGRGTKNDLHQMCMLLSRPLALFRLTYPSNKLFFIYIPQISAQTWRMNVSSSRIFYPIDMRLNRTRVGSLMRKLSTVT